jgi:hypothetical protein
MEVFVERYCLVLRVANETTTSPESRGPEDAIQHCDDPSPEEADPSRA